MRSSILHMMMMPLMAMMFPMMMTITVLGWMLTATLIIIIIIIIVTSCAPCHFCDIWLVFGAIMRYIIRGSMLILILR